MRNLYEFARNSGRENGELEREKNREGSTKITEEPLQNILVLAGTPLN